MTSPNRTLPWILALVLASQPCLARNFTCSFPFGPDKNGKAQSPASIPCWLPDNCKYVRGIVVAHPQVGGFAGNHLIRKVAQDESLGTMVMNAFSYKGSETIERLDKVFEQWAKESGHPEIRGAAVLTAGLSASVLAARNVGYAAPDRVFGIVHIAGGNLHHCLVDERKTLTGIPFFAVNGQFEWCGPDGGIRPHIGRETQWYFIRKDMLAKRKDDPNNLMSLVVVPNADHGAWNAELAALFVRKAAKYRLPKEKRDGSTPAKCVKLTAEDGWLTDGELKHPKHQPAAWADYKGDKTWAFWYFDEELAKAVYKFHKFRPAGLLEKVWPLGEPMDIPFKGHSHPEYAAAVREWMGKKSGMDPSSTAVRYLSAAVARRLYKDEQGKNVHVGTCRKACQKACHAYDDTYKAIDEVIERANLPAEFKDLLRREYAQISLWPLRDDIPNVPIETIKARIAGIPAGSKLLAIKSGQTLHDAIAKTHPAFSKLSAMAQLLVYRSLAKINPCLTEDGSFRVNGKVELQRVVDIGPYTFRLQILDALYAIDPSLKPKNPLGNGDGQGEALAVPIGDGVRMFRFRIGPAGMILIPPAGALARAANPPSVDLKNMWLSNLSVLEDLTPAGLDLSGCDIRNISAMAKMSSLRKLRLTGAPVADLSPLKKLKLTHLDLRDTPVSNLAALKGLPLEHLDISHTKVTDISPLAGMPLKHLDLGGTPVKDLTPLNGMPLAYLKLSKDGAYAGLDALRKIKGLTTVGDTPIEAWLGENEQHHAAKKPQGKSMFPLPAKKKESSQLSQEACWPQPMGPNGNGNAVPAGSQLVDSLTHARLIWTSEEQLPPTYAAGWYHPVPRAQAEIAGGHSSPVLADGRLYVAFYVPSGPVYANDVVERQVKSGGIGREKWYTDADDVVLCVDAATGKTLWRRAFVGQGHNFSAHLTPCVANGKVYLLGTAGRMHCLDAKNGEPIWESQIGFRSVQMKYIRDWCHEKRALWGPGGDFEGCVAAADGVVAVSDHLEHWNTLRYFSDCGLLAFDASTGRTLWRIDQGIRHSVPRRWTHEGKSFFLSPAGDKIYCVEAATGKVMWEAAGNIETVFALEGDLLFCKPPQNAPGLTCYQLSPTEAVKKWELATVAVRADCSPAVDGSHVFFSDSWQEKDQEGQAITVNGLTCLNVADGKMTGQIKCAPARGTLIVSDGRLLAIDTGFKSLAMYDATPAKLKTLGARWALPYASSTLPAVAGGRLFVRTPDRLRCYELRRDFCYIEQDEFPGMLRAFISGPTAGMGDARAALENVAPALVHKAMSALVNSLKTQKQNIVIP